MKNPPDIIAQTPLQRCLMPLLNFLKWAGTERELAESLPHHHAVETVDDFRWVMQNLGYESRSIPTNLKRRLDERVLPCLFVPADGSKPKVLHEIVADGLSIYDSETDQRVVLYDTDINGDILVFKKLDDEGIRLESARWFRYAILPQKKLFYYIGFLTVLQTLLFMGSSIYIISIYDSVIPTGSIEMLCMFTIGAILALVMLVVIMMVRFRLLGYAGAYVQRYVGNTIFRHLLKLPAAYIESVPVGIQLARLHDFAGVRDFFGSALFGTLIEVPFLIIYFAAVWIVGGLLVIIPAVAVLISVCVAILMWAASKRSIQESGVVQTRQQDFLVESLWGMRSIRYAGMQKTWMDRFRTMNSNAMLASHKLLLNNNASDAIFDGLMILSGLATMVVGVIFVLDNLIQIGALIGTMFIIWRILSPIKTLGMMLPKIIQLKKSIGQIDELMRAPPEQKPEMLRKSVPEKLFGTIAFSQVTFRYPAADVSAISDLSLTIKPGQMLALVGPSAAGKSTFVSLLLGLYFPQNGRIFVDGHNLRQYDIGFLRTHIAYVSQKVELFYGTIAQNLRLSSPAATMEQMIIATKAAHIFDDIEALPQKFDTFIKDYGDKQFGASFCQKMNLARAYLRDAPVLVMDEPSTNLDPKSVNALLHYLQEIKGKKTVILISHDIVQIQLADLVVVLSEGRQVMSGDPATILEQIPKGML